MSRRGWARTGALASAGALVLLCWTPASADAPQKYGWWSAANAGALAPPPPPDVPDHGLYVANGFAGPSAISALSFQLSKDSRPGKLVLKVAGNPVVTSGPTACPIAAKSAGYKAEENGAWSDRPSYDCKNKVTGKLSSDKKTVTFDVSSLATSGTLAVAVLAGGPADQIAFEAPGPDTLQPAGSGASALTVGSPTAGSAPGGPAGAFGGSATGGGAAATGGMGGTGGVGQLPSAGSVSTGAGGGAALPPQVSSSGDNGQAPAVAPPGGSAQAPARAAANSAASGHSGNHKVATVIGLAAMVLLLLAYSEGFGVLGGRMTPLNSRRKTVRAGTA